MSLRDTLPQPQSDDARADFMRRIGDQLDALTEEFVSFTTPGLSADVTPVMRASASMAMATLLLLRARRAVPNATLLQDVIDVLQSGDVIAGDRAERRRAERRARRINAARLQ